MCKSTEASFHRHQQREAKEESSLYVHKPASYHIHTKKKQTAGSDHVLFPHKEPEAL